MLNGYRCSKINLSVYCSVVSEMSDKRSSRCSTTSSDYSRISAVDIKNIVDRLRYQQHRDTTQKNYYTVWKIFSKFLVRLDDRPVSWTDHLTLFVGHLIQQNKQSSTVKSYISAIKSVLHDCDIKVNEDQYLLSSLTRACKFKNDQIKTRLPIQKGLLGLILRQVDIKFNAQCYVATLYKAIFSMMYYGLLCISEVASEHAVLARDVHVGANKRKFLLILRTSKTHWKNMKPQMIKISATQSGKFNKGLNHKLVMTSRDYCPYKLLGQYAHVRGSFRFDSEPFFVLSDQSPVTPRQINNVLKTIIHELGFNSKLYSSHGL